jgi:hypothetical protein
MKLVYRPISLFILSEDLCGLVKKGCHYDISSMKKKNRNFGCYTLVYTL